VGKLQLGDVGNHGCYAMFYSANVGEQKNASKIATVDTLVINSVGDSACYQMFYNCSFLATIPSHLAGNSAKSCYQEMFYACAALTSVPQLPAPTAEENCYYKMFNGCSVLPTTPDLPATILAPNCYAYMFNGCKAITAAPELNALQVPAAAYTYMFNGCTALKAAPNLPATKLADNCYAYMFNGCSAMDSVMETLPAAYLANNCYQNMFSSTAITTAPVLVASRFEDKESNAVDNCYNAMFSGCSKLNTIKTYMDNFGEGNQTTNWVSGVPATGDFFCASSLPREYGASRIPQTDADGYRWTLNPLIRMVFNPNGGTWDGEDNSNRSFSPPLTSLPATQKPNCIFLRWDTLANGQGNYRFDWENPLEGDYTYYAIYEPIDFKFIDWRDGKAIIQTTNTTATRCDIKAQDGEVVTTNILSNCAVQGSTGEYALSYDATDVLAYQGKLLNLTLRNNYGDTLGVLVTRIPFVISGNVNSSDLAPSNESDVWITNGATLTINDTREMQTLYVAGGGKIVVPEGYTLTTKKIILRSGELNQEGEYTHCYPQMVVNGSLLNESGIITYEYLLNSTQFFNLCLPYDVNLADVTLCDGTVADKSMAIQYYDGNTRKTGASGWKYLWNPQTSVGAYPTLQAGIGYTICCRAPRVTMKDGTKIRRTYSYLHLPMKVDLSNGEIAEGNARTTPVIPYGMTDGALDDGIKANNAGWNLVGNPYMADYSVPDGLISDNGVGLLEEDDKGQYHWTGTVRYAVIPAEDGQSYTSMVINDITLPAFKNFFIQIGTGDELSFSLAKRAQKAPTYLMTEDNQETMFGVTLSGNGETDRVGLLLSNDYTSAYEINADLDKWTNAGLNLSAQIGDNKLAVAALSAEEAEESIPLSVTIPQNGTYSFALNDEWTSNIANFSHLYLHDTQENIVQDLMVSPYTYSAIKGLTTDRFWLVPVRQTPTSFETTTSNGIFVNSSAGNITISGLNDAEVKIFTMAGVCLYNNSANGSLSVAVPAGVYIIRILQNGEEFTYRQIID
ncbi:MAG: T9SS type A sorting domain-containing protein, partial [Paludibacteraceae bacterium]|nr:T9SS type A sorting domain-containing protein [Paludibacteraceae bacterium]